MTRIVQTLAARSLPRLAGAMLVAGALLLGARSAEAVTPQQQCQAAQIKRAGDYGCCQTIAYSRYVKGYTDAQLTALRAGCVLKFGRRWESVVKRALEADAPCLADNTLVKEKMDSATASVAAVVAGERFEDNGNGTVTDHQTGLQWEKKTTTVGTGTDYGNPHDVDNRYTWNTSGFPFPPTGTAFTDFLVKLNGGSNDGVTLTGCFAGKCDWRLPTIFELQTIQLTASPPCGAVPCIDPVFGPTVALFYWSATTIATNPNRAWDVDFLNGNVSYGYKDFYGYVRAVRAGL